MNKKSAPKIRSKSLSFFVTIKFTQVPNICPFEECTYIFWWIIPLTVSESSPVAVFNVMLNGSYFSPSDLAMSYCIKEFAAPVSIRLLIGSTLSLLFRFLMYTGTKYRSLLIKIWLTLAFCALILALSFKILMLFSIYLSFAEPFSGYTISLITFWYNFGSLISRSGY